MAQEGRRPVFLGIHGLDWPSVEHYSLGGPHAQPSPKLQEYVRGCEDLETARLQANVNMIPLEEYCSALAAAFAARADQDERLRERLLGTGLLRLVAESRAPNLAATQFLSRPYNWSHHRWADIAMAVRARLQAQYECWFNAMDASNVLSNYYAVPSPGLVCPRATALGPLPVCMPQSCGKAAILPMGLPPRAKPPPLLVYPPQILYPPKYYTPLGLISVLPNSIPPFHHIQANETRTNSGHGLNTTTQ